MGYTHYWEYGPEDLNPVLIMTLCQDAKQIVEMSGIPITGWSSRGSESPEFNPEGRLALNGVGNDGCETFSMEFYAPREPEIHGDEVDRYEQYRYEKFIKNNRRLLGFCKTRREPYDAVVTAILLRAFDLFPLMAIDSDGDWSEWREGRHLYFTMFGQEAECPWEQHEVA